MHCSKCSFFMHCGKTWKMNILSNTCRHIFVVKIYHDEYQKQRLNLRTAASSSSLKLHVFFVWKLRKCTNYIFKEISFVCYSAIFIYLNEITGKIHASLWENERCHSIEYANTNQLSFYFIFLDKYFIWVFRKILNFSF